MATNTGTVRELAAGLSQLAGRYEKNDDQPIDVARYEMISKTKDIIAELLTPEDHANQQLFHGMEIFAIRTAEKLGMLQALPSNGSTSSLEELCQKTGAQESLLERHLRMLVATRFISQDSNGRFAHTKFSRGYLGPAGDYFVSVFTFGVPSLLNFPEDLDAHQGLGLVEPDSITIYTFTFYRGREGVDAWKVLAELRDGPEIIRRFQKGVAMLSPMTPVTGLYDFSQLVEDSNGERAVVVDVGGGAGQCLVEVLSAHPKIKPEQAVLQDRPEIIEFAKSNLALPDDVAKMPHDFWTEQPVKGAKAYYMRDIMHGYGDESCMRLLKLLVAAMSADSRILIADFVVPERVEEATLIAPAFNLLMFNVGGKERTAAGFEKILSMAGLELVKIWKTEGIAQAVIEAKLH